MNQTIRSNIVRRQVFWNQWQLKLRQRLAHLVDCIMRRVVCDAGSLRSALCGRKVILLTCLGKVLHALYGSYMASQGYTHLGGGC